MLEYCQSTTVEIILYYLTAYYDPPMRIYNSRNYSILLNVDMLKLLQFKSTTVEIILYYLTYKLGRKGKNLQQ